MKVGICVIDYETKEIEARSSNRYPPEPVGAAIIEPNKSPYYMSWGHPCENNCTKKEAHATLKRLYNKYVIVCHNAKFDLEVSEKHFGLPLVPKYGFQCTMILAFLFNPREFNLRLKPLADKYLNMPPDEQLKLKEWLIANVPEARKAKTKWGKYISKAPGKLAGRYAKGDVIRTKKLFIMFHKFVSDNGMLNQYDIEKKIMIRTIDLERTGIRVDEKTLEPDLEAAERKRKRAENKIYKVLGEINLNSPAQKIVAFEKAGLVKQWEYGEPTKKGIVNPKTGIESLMRVCTDKKLVEQLHIYSKLTKVIGTYMKPWLESARENNGVFYPWFNTLKGEDDKGTYTGRFSSNFQQVPRIPDKKLKWLPHLRSYIIPDKKSHILLNRDFSQQELRILAHYEDADMLEMYQIKPDTDAHDFTKDRIYNITGKDLDRNYVKACNFLLVYGGGIAALARTLKISEAEAKEIISAHKKALPGVGELTRGLIAHAKEGNTFKTAGGRIYAPDRGYEYITLNTLIQGGAADHAKRAMLAVCDVVDSRNYDARLILQVHDELMISGQRSQKKKIMADVREAMEYDELFDLEMLTDGKWGENWGEMLKVNW